MLREAKALVEVVRRTQTLLDTSNYRIVAVAPYESQRRALRELGVEAKTVASFLAAREEPPRRPKPSWSSTRPGLSPPAR